ncbi:MAG: undecaprenyldiphospho-muramoylpentapeptide beta-N-acetylglucosaminyltransferase [Candidatus Zixiibacteriota bacterium]|nr:MAG: undecaprenyldiphospho-muramoylpentapeptide beta-N-acetylglucosaminyltransferase [candidate division Zixibacteria bacterium]
MTAQASARLIFAGGGTGGHLFPAIAVANRVRELLAGTLPVEILFVGTKRGLEYRMREKLGYRLHTIHMRGIVRGLTLLNLLVPFVVFAALIRAHHLLGRFKPDIVVGTGGYVCWPVLKVAAWKKITTFLQEQNSYPGVATRQLAGRAKKIYLGFERAGSYLKTDAEIVVSGNPVRSNIAAGDRARAREKFGLRPDVRTILVLGGSQGARAINQAVLSSLENKRIDHGFQLLWQTGKRDYKEVVEKAAKRVENCALFPFAEEMELVYAAADMVIARAGALSLAEIAACGLPSLLIPYPHAAGDHQRRNAEDYVARGMALMIEEKNIGQVDILEEARKLLVSPRLGQMKEAIEREAAGKKPAVDIIAEDIVAELKAMKRVGVKE